MRSLFEEWAYLVRPAQLRYARVLGSDNHFLIRIEWNEGTIDYPVVLTDWHHDEFHSCQNRKEFEFMLRSGAGVMGADKKGTAGMFWPPVQMTPVIWEEDKWQNVGNPVAGKSVSTKR